MLTSGKVIGLLFTYEDGSLRAVGPWEVPHDSDYAALDAKGTEVGWHIFHEIAKQPFKTVAKVEVVPWDDPRVGSATQSNA